MQKPYFIIPNLNKYCKLNCHKLKCKDMSNCDRIIIFFTKLNNILANGKYICYNKINRFRQTAVILFLFRQYVCINEKGEV